MTKESAKLNVLFTEDAFLTLFALDPEKVRDVMSALHDWYFCSKSPDDKFYEDSERAIAWISLAGLNTVYVNGPTFDDISSFDCKRGSHPLNAGN